MGIWLIVNNFPKINYYYLLKKYTVLGRAVADLVHKSLCLYIVHVLFQMTVEM